jgi:hypothetical protein
MPLVGTAFQAIKAARARLMTPIVINADRIESQAASFVEILEFCGCSFTLFLLPLLVRFLPSLLWE